MYTHFHFLHFNKNYLQHPYFSKISYLKFAPLFSPPALVLNFLTKNLEPQASLPVWAIRHLQPFFLGTEGPVFPLLEQLWRTTPSRTNKFETNISSFRWLGLPWTRRRMLTLDQGQPMAAERRQKAGLILSSSQLDTPGDGSSRFHAVLDQMNYDR